MKIFINKKRGQTLKRLNSAEKEIIRDVGFAWLSALSKPDTYMSASINVSPAIIKLFRPIYEIAFTSIDSGRTVQSNQTCRRLRAAVHLIERHRPACASRKNYAKVDEVACHCTLLNVK